MSKLMGFQREIMMTDRELSDPYFALTVLQKLAEQGAVGDDAKLALVSRFYAVLADRLTECDRRVGRGEEEE